MVRDKRDDRGRGRRTLRPRLGIGPTRILELIPNERLAHDWATSDDEPPMVVCWELEGSGGRTHLTVVQSGFSSEAHAAGWSVGLASRVASLKRMLEVGVDGDR